MNSDKIKECTTLAKEILGEFELNSTSIHGLLFKALRLCEISNDKNGILLFTYECSGYPINQNGTLTPESWVITAIAGRRYYKFDEKAKVNKEYACAQLLPDLEEAIKADKIRLGAAADPDISISSSNPAQHVYTPRGNVMERVAIAKSIRENTAWVTKIKGALYKYILSIYNRLQYGNILENIFDRAKNETNEKLGSICPTAIEKFISAYENVASGNAEDWANAVHSCRRILLDLADALYPPSDTPVLVNGKEIKVGADQYVNRLIQYIQSKSTSNTYKSVVGSDLSSIGERIDAVTNASHKGTHKNVTKEEAERYIMHTYFLISDILSL